MDNQKLGQFTSEIKCATVFPFSRSRSLKFLSLTLYLLQQRDELH